MIMDNYYSIHLLLISNAMVVAAATIAIMRLQRLLRNSAAFPENPTDSVMYAQGDSDNTKKLVDQRLSSLQKIVFDLVRKQNIVQAPTAEKLPLENAMRMAKHGASVEDLTRSCGLSKGEAQLLMRVHANVTSPADAH